MLLVPAPAGAGDLSEGVFAADDDFAEYAAERADRHRLSVDDYLLALRTQEDQAWVVERVNANPDRFAGVYWDWRASVPEFVVQYVGADAPQLHPDVREVSVRYSRAELLRILDELDRATDAMDAGVAGLVSIGIDDLANAVTVVATNETPEVLSLVAEYGDAVTVGYQPVR